MSKKKSLLYQRFHSKQNPGNITDIQTFAVPEPKESFSKVLKHLVEQKYIYLTEEGYCHLLPKGLFIHEALVAYAAEMLDMEGAIRYRFSSFFSTNGKDGVATLISRFKKHIYKVFGNQEQYLKYASDPVLFKYLQEREIITPHKIYSPDYFFRVIQTGELRPLIQPREFFMTDFHFFCEPNDLDEYIKASVINKNTVEMFTDNWYLTIDTNVQFFESNQEFFSDLLTRMEVDAIINVTTNKTHYYSIQSQFMVDYYEGNKTQLANLQFDEQNGEEFHIISASSNKAVSIIHGTLLGRTEKVLALVIGKQLEKERKPILPIWLSPIIVRILPITNNEKTRNTVDKIASELQRISCRYDVDDRNQPLSKKVLEAERDWIPFQAIIGKQEIENGTIMIRNRKNGINTPLSQAEFITMLNGIDNRPQTMPRKFYGNAIY